MRSPPILLKPLFWTKRRAPNVFRKRLEMNKRSGTINWTEMKAPFYSSTTTSTSWIMFDRIRSQMIGRSLTPHLNLFLFHHLFNEINKIECKSKIWTKLNKHTNDKKILVDFLLNVLLKQLRLIHFLTKIQNEKSDGVLIFLFVFCNLYIHILIYLYIYIVQFQRNIFKGNILGTSWKARWWVHYFAYLFKLSILNRTHFLNSADRCTAFPLFSIRDVYSSEMKLYTYIYLLYESFSISFLSRWREDIIDINFSWKIL